MSETHVYTMKEGASNKMWSYIINGKTVIKKWGRIGGHITEESKTYPSEYQAQSDIQRQAQKKLDKGYKQADEESLEKETEIANCLGAQYKINRIEFINQPWDNSPRPNTLDLEFGKEYDSEFGVCVEILQSWSKETYYLVLSKKHTAQFTSGSITGNGASLAGYTYPDGNFVSGVKKCLHGLQEVVHQVLVKFGAVGARTLSLGDDDEVESTGNQEFFKAVSAKSSGGFSNQVVSKFAALGARVLDI